MAVTVEQMLGDALDVSELKRAGVFTDDWVTLYPSLRWPAIARMLVARYRIVIDIRGQSVPQGIVVSWVRCRYGGRRPYLHCPHCQRRVRRLLRGFGGYACRTCCGTPIYESQRCSPARRPLLRAYRLRQKLGGSRPVLDPLPPRPARMRRRTYARLCAELKALELALVGRQVTRNAPGWFPPLRF